ncbi:UPF0182 family protein [Myxosarcina sp. GI1]|uniref:UPF0182 family membrane protein n=1 Tax=Myxosarcina sp. GI1 TaxID=1541065 RepID=UPI00056D528F|nr:UPF0182 family protein [Myxosarcina sp. GI1]
MQLQKKISLAIIVLAIAGLTFASTLIHLLTELWWFEAVEFADIFWKRISWQIIIWVGTLTVFALFLWLNYWLALRLTKDRAFRFLEASALEPFTKKVANYIAIVLIFLSSFAVANASSSAWETILKYFNATNFNSSDPVYDKDIGFYLFRLPLYGSIQDWLLTLLIAGLVLAALVYLFKGTIQFNWQWKSFVVERNWHRLLTKPIKIHLSLLLAAIAINVAFDFWLERYELLYSSAGVVWGADYTDTHARLLAYWVMTFGSILLGVFLIAAIWSRRALLPVYGIIAYTIVLILVNGIYPELQQRLIVEPNELAKELPYIKHNIAYTRSAYNLDRIEDNDYQVSNTANSIQPQNRATIDNIRLWDYRALLSTYRQLQEIRFYYRFKDVDVDRYTIDNNYRQVMLSPREFDYSKVPQTARTWVNQRLKYTHGYGLVMNPVNRVTSDGLPVFWIKNIPPVSEVDLQVKEPAIYYGEETSDYIFTGMSTPEFDYPRGDENTTTKYDGAGGVPIPSLLRKLAYAYDLGSLKILISQYFTSDSRIHYHRQVRERVSHVAPFLKFDRDPYIALINGRLQWIIDAYTTSKYYPYSEPVAHENETNLIEDRNINYIRNSVKVVVDAKDGTMQFYIVDNRDPVLATYRKIFPTLFKASNTIPPEVKAHFRYPLDLFKIQAKMYLTYHMSDPQVFYNREDLWRFSTELYDGAQQPSEPYYLIMRLPGEDREEFALILPFTPVNKDNMIAWMAARSDGENYGNLLLYEFSKQELVYGPFQIEARIDQNPEIAQQLTLWSQQGSRVIRGDLLVIPIDGSLLYVEPIYLRAEQGELPELKRVIVAYNKDVVMTPTLEQSLAQVFGDSPPAATATQPTANNINSDLTRSALDTYQKAQEALSQGNWAEYGRYQQQLKEILQELDR